MRTYFALSELLRQGRPATIVMLGDTGFIAGAGIGMRRQAQSFLRAGHDVAVVCWLEDGQREPLHPLGGEFAGRWLGFHALPEVHSSNGYSDAEIARQISDKIEGMKPDLVICGNFHWARWPLEIIEILNARDIAVVAYLHDCHWITGRCAYMGGCSRFLHGCDEHCPTPDQYPSLRRDRIAGAWRKRRSVFTGVRRVPLGANSTWMLRMAQEGFGGHSEVELLHLGLDETLYSPFDKKLARRLLGLGEDVFTVIMGAVDMGDSRKGGPILRQVAQHFELDAAVQFIAFGHNSEYFPGVKGFGNITDERLMPILFNAADVILNTAREEAFGQTLMEAASCGTALVTFAPDGVPDIARNGVNAVTLPCDASAPVVISVLSELSTDLERCRRMGAAGREIVLKDFTLERQYERWSHFLMDVPDRLDAFPRVERVQRG